MYADDVHVGCKGWIGIRLDRGLDWEVAAQFVREAYLLTAPNAWRH
jgi:hypothetical protein